MGSGWGICSTESELAKQNFLYLRGDESECLADGRVVELAKWEMAVTEIDKSNSLHN